MRIRRSAAWYVVLAVPFLIPPPAAAEDAAPHQRSALCDIPHFEGMTQGGTTARMRLRADGGDCGVALYYHPGNRTPFDRLWVGEPPQHGTVELTGSRLRYRPAAGYVGGDRFTVESVPSGHLVVVVTVEPAS